MKWLRNMFAPAGASGMPLYNLPPGTGLSGETVGGGWAEQPASRRHLFDTGGGDMAWYNPGLGCFRALHYGERQLPGRVYAAYSPPLGFSEWLR